MVAWSSRKHEPESADLFRGFFFSSPKRERGRLDPSLTLRAGNPPLCTVNRGCRRPLPGASSRLAFRTDSRRLSKKELYSVFLGIFSGPAHHFSYDETSQRG